MEELVLSKDSIDNFINKLFEIIERKNNVKIERIKKKT